VRVVTANPIERMMAALMSERFVDELEREVLSFTLGVVGTKMAGAEGTASPIVVGASFMGTAM